MAEQISQEQTTTTTTVAPDLKAELAQQMAISLNNGVAPEPDVPAAPTTSDPAAPTTTADPFGLFKEKFGYESPEAAVQEIESLRAFRAAPPPAELKFENEQSKAIAEALQAGPEKFHEVHAILDKMIRIDQLTTGDLTHEAAANVIKLGMQLKYPDLKPEEINYKFNKTYGLPPKPGMLPAEDQEEFDERLRNWEAVVADKQMEMMIDAKLARPDLAAAKSKLVIPTIARQQDADFQEWQKTVQENDRLAAETTQVYKAFTPKSLETKVNFVDEASKIAFEFYFEPDPESFNQSVDMVTDINKFWESFKTPDGSPDRIGFLRSMYIAKNFEKMITQAMIQAKNATIKASLPDNTAGGLVRQMPPTQVPNELDTLMRASLKGYGGF